MQTKVVETLTGAVILLICAVFLIYAYRYIDRESNKNNYDIFISFSDVNGIGPGSDVRMAGIKIGTVQTATLNPKTYTPTLQLSINRDIKLPEDSSARITSSGLLGSNYISITPGGDESFIKPGGSISYAQGAVDLMGLIGQAILGVTHSSQGTAHKPAN